MGWAIIRVEKVEPNFPKDFEKNKKALRDQAVQEKLQAVQSQLDQKLKTSAKIEYKDPILIAYKALDKAMMLPMKSDTEKKLRAAEFKKVLELYKTAYDKTADPAIWARIGWIYKQELKDYDKAIAAYTKARQGVSDPVIDIALGDTYRLKGNKTAAAKAYKDASDEAWGPTTAYYHQQIQQGYLALGDKASADKEAKLVKELQDQMAKQQQMMMQQQLQAQQQQQSKPAPRTATKPEPKGGR